MAEAKVREPVSSPTPTPYPPTRKPVKPALPSDIAKAEKVRDAVCKGAKWLGEINSPLKPLGKVGNYICQAAKYSEKLAENPGDLENKMTRWIHRNLPNPLVRGLEFLIQLGE